MQTPFYFEAGKYRKGTKERRTAVLWAVLGSGIVFPGRWLEAGGRKPEP